MRGKGEHIHQFIAEEAYRELGDGKDDEFVQDALWFIERSKETNPRTLISDARSHAYKKARERNVDEQAKCQECDGRGYFTMKTTRYHAHYIQGGSHVTEDLLSPAVCRVAYRCPVCNKGSHQRMATSKGFAYSEFSRQVEPIPHEAA